MATTHSLQTLTKLVGDFVVQQDGFWNHEQWETLCSQVGALGMEMDESFQEHLGLMLEHLRVFYFCLPAAAPAKPKAKPKAKAKAKAKTKAKAKPKSAAVSVEADPESVPPTIELK